MDFGDGAWIVGRKEHRCEGCLGRIPKGEKHFQYKGRYDGVWQNWRLHEECHEDWISNQYEEFMPGDMTVPERVARLDTTT